MGTMNGFGTTYYGARDRREDGSVVTTKWFVMWALPILPLGTARIRHEGESRTREHGIRTDTMYYRVLEKLPPNLGQILQTYCAGFAIVPLIIPGIFVCSPIWGVALPEWFETFDAVGMILIYAGLGLGALGLLVPERLSYKGPAVICALLAGLLYTTATYRLPWQADDPHTLFRKERVEPADLPKLMMLLGGSDEQTLRALDLIESLGAAAAPASDPLGGMLTRGSTASVAARLKCAHILERLGPAAAEAHEPLVEAVQELGYDDWRLEGLNRPPPPLCSAMLRTLVAIQPTLPGTWNALESVTRLESEPGIAAEARAMLERIAQRNDIPPAFAPDLQEILGRIRIEPAGEAPGAGAGEDPEGTNTGAGERQVHE